MKRMKKIMLFLAAALTISLTSCNKQATVEVRTFKIYTEDDLWTFAQFVNADPALNAILMENITLNRDSNWEAVPFIQNNHGYYKGIFDGNGKTISGLKIDNTSEHGVGFFRYLSGATVKDLTIDNATITSIHRYTGTIAGGIEEGSVVSNCHITATTITSSAPYTGGVVGLIEGEGSMVTKCSNAATITSTSSYVGGITGYAESRTQITDCTNTGSATGDEFVDDIVGYILDEQ